MPYGDYRSIRIEIDAAVASATLDHPPINLLDLERLLSRL